MRLFLGASDTPARLRPLAPATLERGGIGLVEIRTRRPVVAARGDRLLLRRLSPEATLGGGEVLDPRWRRPRAGELAARLAALSGGEEEALRGWLAAAAEAGASAAEVAERLGSSPVYAEVALRGLANSGRAISGAGRWFAPAPLAELERRAVRLLTEQADREPLSGGLPRAELAHRLLDRRARSLADFHLGWLARRGVVTLEADRARLPGRRAEPDEAEGVLAAAIVAAYEGEALAPVSPAEVARRLAAKPATVDGLVRHLIGRGRLIRLSGGLVMAAAAFETLRGELESSGWERFGVGEFKARFALTRKFAIPLARAARRARGDPPGGGERVLLRRRPEGVPASNPLEKNPGG